MLKSKFKLALKRTVYAKTKDTQAKMISITKTNHLEVCLFKAFKIKLLIIDDFVSDESYKIKR